jgi:hypothetical protein
MRASKPPNELASRKVFILTRFVTMPSSELCRANSTNQPKRRLK